mgnify:CR=1 FL=1
MAEWNEKDHPRDGNNQKFVKKGSDGAYNSQENKAKALAKTVEKRHNNTGILKKKKGIRSLNKQIEKHKDKINNPEKYVKDWESLSQEKKMWNIDYWEKEIKRYEKNIEKIKKEIGE